MYRWSILSFLQIHEKVSSIICLTFFIGRQAGGAEAAGDTRGVSDPLLAPLPESHLRLSRVYQALRQPRRYCDCGNSISELSSEAVQNAQLNLIPQATSYKKEKK